MLNALTANAMTHVASASPFYAFQQSDFVGKAVVVFLFIGSIFTWAIMIEKGLYLSKAMRQARQFKDAFRDARRVLSAYARAEMARGPLADLYIKGADEILSFIGLSPDALKASRGGAAPKGKLTTAQIETVRSVLERGVADKILELEDKMGLLATTVSASPFFGLFGTVWGVMMSFCGMALAGKADISAMAPGISGALLTTVVGLVVAIPSLIGYNMLSNIITKLTVFMDNFVEEFMSKVKLEQHDLETGAAPPIQPNLPPRPTPEPDASMGYQQAQSAPGAAYNGEDPRYVQGR